MDALGIVLHDIVLRDIIYPGHNLTLPVTFATQVRDVHLIGTGFGIGMMEDVMVTMTLFAAGSMRVIHEQGLTVNPSYIIFHLKGMAVTAIDRLQVIGMRKSLIRCVGMAGDTAVAVVDRMGKYGGIHKHGDGSAI
jgi:hypothetical protein